MTTAKKMTVKDVIAIVKREVGVCDSKAEFIELAEQTMIMMFNKDEFATKYGITDYDLVNDAFNDILDGNFKF